MFHGLVSYWQLPIIAAVTWFGTLLAMLIVWLAQGRPIYPSMERGQTIAYISDIGATGLKPLFIAGSAVSMVVFVLAFVSERWLRHKGRLARNNYTSQKILSIFASIFAIIGAAGLILLTIFDTRSYSDIHNVFLGVFIIGYIISAIFICAEYQRMGVHFRQYSILRQSFWIKLMFIIVEIAIGIAFIVCQKQRKRNAAAVLEWTISLIYIFYQLSFIIDFLPAVRTKDHESRFPTAREMAMATENGPSISGGPVYPEEHSTRYPGPNGLQSDQYPMESGYGTPMSGSSGQPQNSFVGHQDGLGRDSYSSEQPLQMTGQPQMYPQYPHRNF